MSYCKMALSLAFSLVALLIMLAAPQVAWAQGGLQQQPLQMPRDPALEKDAKHNLEVAKFYMKKKAYKGVTDRLLEIVYTYPSYSRFDEVLSLLGEAFLRLDKKDEAAKFYKRLVDDFPESEFAKVAKQRLSELPVENSSK